MASALVWDVFCKVVDNYGDIGVCWRLAADLASRGHRVRLRTDDATALRWMAPDGHAGVEVLPWDTPAAAPAPGGVVVEAFGCEPPDAFVTALAEADARARREGATPPLWLNLEYLSAEDYVERSHGLPSPLQAGPGRGLTRHFFYPGFTPATGGLLREPGLLERRESFDRADWLRQQGIDWRGEMLVSLFCYDPAALPELLAQLSAGTRPALLLVTPGRAAQAAAAAMRSLAWSPGTAQRGRLRMHPMAALPQTGFDHLLWACDLNFVRGEDSLVRALWAGKPLVWQLYPQNDGAHGPKLQAWLRRLDVPESLRRFHAVWNGLEAGPLGVPEAAAWAPWAARASDSLARQADLTTQLLQFVAKKS